MIIKDKELKKKLEKLPEKDRNGDPIFKIADNKKEDRRVPKGKSSK